ncbi:MAG TPA: 16S rRNA (cytosine(1402)-N(4))-methyltransferase RsmH [candidate division Zixibacteria bacterium]|nr:16S rRNA (cytosine(1402)-N(4))-methyltransferase RsmH [candidate division Zixibacteria bacterium]
MTASSNSGPHQPVMVDEVVHWLVTDTEGAYIDGTVGSGGYLKAISAVAGKKARLYGIDLDREAVARSRSNLSECPQRFQIIHGSYAEIAQLADGLPDRVFDGILLDLGLSSEQLDSPERGFAFRLEGPLDMRFTQAPETRSAADLINSLPEKKLAEIIRNYGEERQANRIAGRIVRERQNRMIRTTADLSDIVASVVPSAHLNKSLARVFQALRIAVNLELESLTKALPDMRELLKPGGRLAVISYHSLEDRIVKQFFQEQENPCQCPPGLPVCVCGARPTMRRLTRRAIIPGKDEMASNPRSRSAKLRVAEKLM